MRSKVAQTHRNIFQRAAAVVIGVFILVSVVHRSFVYALLPGVVMSFCILFVVMWLERPDNTEVGRRKKAEAAAIMEALESGLNPSQSRLG